MTTYRIEMMTSESYHNYMCGSNNYFIKTIEVEADSKEEAIAIVKAKNKENNDDYVINDKYVITVEEYEKTEAEKKAKWEAYEKAQAEKRAKRRERENQPGVKAKRNYKRANTEIEKAKKEIETLKRKIAYYENKKVEYAKQYKEETGEEI